MMEKAVYVIEGQKEIASVSYWLVIAIKGQVIVYKVGMEMMMIIIVGQNEKKVVIIIIGDSAFVNQIKKAIFATAITTQQQKEIACLY